MTRGMDSAGCDCMGEILVVQLIKIINSHERQLRCYKGKPPALTPHDLMFGDSRWRLTGVHVHYTGKSMAVKERCSSSLSSQGHPQ